MNGRRTSLGYCWACGPRPRMTAPSPLPSWYTAFPWSFPASSWTPPSRQPLIFWSTSGQGRFLSLPGPFACLRRSPTSYSSRREGCTSREAGRCRRSHRRTPGLRPWRKRVRRPSRCWWADNSSGSQWTDSSRTQGQHPCRRRRPPARRGRPQKERTAVVAATTRTYAEVVAGGGSL